MMFDGDCQIVLEFFLYGHAIPSTSIKCIQETKESHHITDIRQDVAEHTVSSGTVDRS
jgi:hypothetical protein